MGSYKFSVVTSDTSGIDFPSIIQGLVTLTPETWLQ